MNARGRLAGLTLIIVVLCTLGYALVGEGITWPLIGLVCVGVNLAIHGIEGREQFMLPRWIVVCAAIAVLGWAVTRAMGGFKIDALCECVLALMFIKLWDRRYPADYAQILTLAVYLAIGCTVRGDFGPFVVTALCVPAILAATMLFQIFSSQHRFTRHGSRPSVVQWSNASFASLFFSGLVLIAMVSALVFVLMPRGPMLESVGMRSTPSWVARLGGVARVSKFSDHVELGRGGLISESRAIVAEVTVLPEENGERKAIDILRLRGAVLENYEKGSWRERSSPSNASRNVESEELRARFLKTIAGVPNSHSAARSIRIRVAMRDVDLVIPLFAPWWPAFVEYPSSSGLSVDRRTLIMQRPGQTGPFSYTVQSYLGASADPKLSESRLSKDRPSVSFPNQVITELTKELLRKSVVEPDPALRPPSEDARAARAIEAYLRKEFKYTLDLLAAPPDKDPIEWFLTTAKKGHCEYFASAMVAMCRSVGIPARLVTGYVAAEVSTPWTFVVRESNAHAWVEAAVDGFPPDESVDVENKDPMRWHSWRTFDPTPPADFQRVHQPEPSVGLRFGKFLSSIESAWSSNILRFDDRRQSSILGAQATPTWAESKLNWLAKLIGEKLAFLRDKWGPVGFVLIVMIFALTWGSRLMVRHLRRRRAQFAAVMFSGIQPQLMAIRDSYTRALGRQDLARLPQEPLLAHLDRCRTHLAAANAELPQLAFGLIQLLYRGQFGEGLNPGQLSEARRMCERIELLLRSEKPART